MIVIDCTVVKFLVSEALRVPNWLLVLHIYDILRKWGFLLNFIQHSMAHTYNLHVITNFIHLSVD